LLKDEVVLQIAAMNPKNMEEMAQVRGALKHLSADSAQSLMEALEAARLVPREDYPKDEKKKRMLQPEQEGLVDVLKMLLKLQCDTHHVAPRLVAHKDDLAALVLGQTDVPCLQGWRHEIFGQKAENFLQGRLLLKAEKGTIRFEERTSS
jgi:ribonuclease D